MQHANDGLSLRVFRYQDPRASHLVVVVQGQQGVMHLLGARVCHLALEQASLPIDGRVGSVHREGEESRCEGAETANTAWRLHRTPRHHVSVTPERRKAANKAHSRESISRSSVSCGQVGRSRKATLARAGLTVQACRRPRDCPRTLRTYGFPNPSII